MLYSTIGFDQGVVALGSSVSKESCRKSRARSPSLRLFTTPFRLGLEHIYHLDSSCLPSPDLDMMPPVWKSLSLPSQRSSGKSSHERVISNSCSCIMDGCDSSRSRYPIFLVFAEADMKFWHTNPFLMRRDRSQIFLHL
jgi:hypothetical protein